MSSQDDHHNRYVLTKTTEDFLFATFYAASIGASVVALVFLLIDAVKGEPFFTPSLLGSVMFAGAEASLETPVRLDMVAYYSIVHMTGFGLIGAVLAFLVHEVELHSKHPGQFYLVFFLICEGAFLIVSRLFMPGVNEVLGFFRIFLANLFAAAAMAIFFYQSHHENAWQQFKKAANLS